MIEICHYQFYRLSFPRVITGSFSLHLIRSEPNLVAIPVEGFNRSLPFTLLTDLETTSLKITRKTSRYAVEYPGIRVVAPMKIRTHYILLRVKRMVDIDNLYKHLIPPGIPQFTLVAAGSKIINSIPFVYRCPYNIGRSLPNLDNETLFPDDAVVPQEIDWTLIEGIDWSEFDLK